MSIVYDGFLQTRVAEWIANAAKEYSHAIEMSSLPLTWTEWVKENLVDYNSTTENCMGQSYSRKTKMYSLIRRSGEGEPLFLFLKSQQEKNAVMRAFPDLIVNESPFKTVIS